MIDRVGKLELDHERLQPKVAKMSNKVIDLQCRSMRENLIQNLNQLNEPKDPRENQSTVKTWNTR